MFNQVRAFSIMVAAEDGSDLRANGDIKGSPLQTSRQAACAVAVVALRLSRTQYNDRA